MAWNMQEKQDEESALDAKKRRRLGMLTHPCPRV